MLANTTPEQRKFIFLKFAKELIKNSAPIEVYELEDKLEKNKPPEKVPEKGLEKPIEKTSFQTEQKETPEKPSLSENLKKLQEAIKGEKEKEKDSEKKPEQQTQSKKLPKKETKKIPKKSLKKNTEGYTKSEPLEEKNTGQTEEDFEIKAKPIDKNLIRRKIQEDFSKNIGNSSYQSLKKQTSSKSISDFKTSSPSLPEAPSPEQTQETPESSKKIPEKTPKQLFTPPQPTSEKTTPKKPIIPPKKTINFSQPSPKQPKQINPPQQKKIPLPKALQEVRPVPEEKEITLPKINSFVNDPSIKEIECPGKDSEIILRGNRGTQNTNMYLTQEDIENIVKEFSKKTKIPVQQGIYKVVYGNLSLIAVISEEGTSKFTIKKIPLNPVSGFDRNFNPSAKKRPSQLTPLPR